ncbi:Rieske (2Fe-2S) protein, partial [Pseudonocardia abyssalis]
AAPDPAAPAASIPVADALAAAATIPVGGGRVFADLDLVVTQPTAGEFRAFSATCTHQGCAVTEVTDGQIVCPCHGSTFSAVDGSPTAGPAAQPLPRRTVAVRDGSVVPA